MSDVDDEEVLKSQLFVIRLGELLDEGKTEDAEELFRAASARGDAAKSLWEIVPAVASRLTSENATERHELFATCEKLLGALARECNAKETLLLLVESMENCRDSATFRSILSPLRESLLRVGPERAVDWCAESIRRYARALPCPENVKPPNGEERTDATVRRLCGDYATILTFLEPLVHSTGVRSLWTSRALLGIEANKENGLGTDGRSAGKESDEEYERSIKKKILSASLNFVNEYGWSQQAISAGAESVGYPGIIHGMFPNGGAELVQHFYTSCNADLNNILKAEALAIDARPAGTKKTPESQIRDALEKRLRMVIPYKSTWPQALGLMALPPNVPTSLANILTLVDDICYYAGDRSVDFNWYTRRVVLAGIYKTTELYLLQDSSEDHRKTWEFMERRIEDAVQVNRVISVTSDLPPPDKAFNRATEAASAAFITARNILGLNWNR